MWRPESDLEQPNRLIVKLEQHLLQVLNQRQNIAWLFEQPEWTQLCQWVDTNPFQAFAFARIKSGHAMTPRHGINVFLMLRAWLIHSHKVGSKLEPLSQAALLHDLGHWRPPDLVYVFAPFSHEQARLKWKHCQVDWDEGFFGDEARQWINEHHEQPNQKGYPQQIKPHVLSQMLRIVDVFDGLATPRRFRVAYEYVDALRLMKRWAGHHYERGLLKSLIQFFGTYPVGTYVRLTNKSLAIALAPCAEGQHYLQLSDQEGTALPFNHEAILLNPQVESAAKSWQWLPLPDAWKGLRPDLVNLPRAYFDELEETEP
ncbi:MAG: HD domain-containing protein [Acidobacteria bacterium]|nr:HD domain-containing protein [Acidobacteriota bacterium]MCB9398218.1 HD domain-containing protein [Acidobacteriota bacterium]